MLYLVHTELNIPDSVPVDVGTQMRLSEKEYSQELQRQGRWASIWRVVGEHASYSILDVESHDELHAILSGLPLFPYMKIQVTALARHPSAIN